MCKRWIAWITGLLDYTLNKFHADVTDPEKAVVRSIDVVLKTTDLVILSSVVAVAGRELVSVIGGQLVDARRPSPVDAAESTATAASALDGDGGRAIRPA